MRKALAFVAAAILLGHGALAADLAVRAQPTSAPNYTSDPWNGIYFGGNFGYGVNQGDTTGTLVGLGSTSASIKPQGFVGGGHAGYNFHVPGSSFVVGLEGDVDIATLDGTFANPGFIGNVNSKNRVLASIRGRLGFLLTSQLMIYGTGGWGWSTADFTVTGTDGSQVNFSPTLSGAVLGGGVDYAVTANWLFGVEYLHYFLNDINGAGSGMMAGVPVNFVFNASENVNVVRGRVTYKF